jgi:LysR family transcriptional regulator, hypochlorite-specific transcription factor HypT
MRKCGPRKPNPRSTPRAAMETKWLEDFLSLAETGSFSRSAASRNVTQPAFSRRIRSLETWLGVDLIDRTSYPTRLTKAGEVFREQALEMLAQVQSTRAMLRGQRPSAQGTVDFAVPHTLSLTYFPGWLTQVQKSFRPLNTRLVAANVHDAVMTLVEGGCDVLLCYHHPRQPVQLDAARYEMKLLGTESLQAYSATNRHGEPSCMLPGKASQPVPYLAYSSGAYLARMVELALGQQRRAVHLDKRYETDMAEGLKMMALEGHGLAFLPASAVARELKAKRLAPAGEGWKVEMEIRLYREKPSALRPGKPVVQELWEHLSA